MRIDNDACSWSDDYLDLVLFSSIVSQNQVILLYSSFLIVIMSHVRKFIVLLTDIQEWEVWILGIPFLLKSLVDTWHAYVPFAKQGELLAISQAPPLVAGAREMPAPKVVVIALKISMWISEWRHSSLAQAGIYFSSMNYQGWARLSVSVNSQDFVHLKNLLTHLCVFFFLCLSCAVITYGVSNDILIN